MNLQRLKSLLNNDDQLVERFIEIFIRETPKQLTGLGNAIKTKQYKEAALIAHAIKSQLKYIGLDDLAAVAARIEQETDNNLVSDKLSVLFRKLHHEILQVINAL